jgi:hypothetical protein
MFRAFFNKMFSPPTQQTTAEGAAMVKEFCDGLIKSKPVVVFSKTYCPYCTKAKQALGELPLAKDALEVVELVKKLKLVLRFFFVFQISGPSPGLCPNPRLHEGNHRWKVAQFACWLDL